MAIAANWYILWSFGIFFITFGMLYPEKSGNPVLDPNPKSRSIYSHVQR
jgi:hypothetical protein